MLEAFLAFREDVIARRTKFDLAKARDRAHILVGLATAVTNIDEVIKLIRTSANPKEAREKLMARPWSAALFCLMTGQSCSRKSRRALYLICA